MYLPHGLCFCKEDLYGRLSRFVSRRTTCLGLSSLRWTLTPLNEMVSFGTPVKDRRLPLSPDYFSSKSPRS